MFPSLLSRARPTARRALDLARAILLVELPLQEPLERVEWRTTHRTKPPARIPRARRRGGAVPARPQRCISPLVRVPAHTPQTTACRR
jgi:hypothetical protein